MADYRTKPLAGTAGVLFLDDISRKVQEIGPRKWWCCAFWGSTARNRERSSPAKELLFFLSHRGGGCRGLAGPCVRPQGPGGGLLRASGKEPEAHHLRWQLWPPKGPEGHLPIRQGAALPLFIGCAPWRGRGHQKRFKACEARWVVEEKRAVKCTKERIMYGITQKLNKN